MQTHPAEPIKRLLQTFLTSGLTAYKPLTTSTPFNVPAFTTLTSIPIYIDEVPMLLETGEPASAAGPDVVIYCKDDPKPQYSMDLARWVIPLAFDLTLPPDTTPDDAQEIWEALWQLLTASLSADEPTDGLRSPLIPRLQFLATSTSIPVWFHDVIEMQSQEIFKQLDSGGLTRGMFLTFIAETLHT